jgi:peptidoglycan hydrolase-like protein with peptidoglycan-binding domain
MAFTLAISLAALLLRFSGGSLAEEALVQSAADSGKGSALVTLPRAPERGNLLLAAVTASEPTGVRAPDGWKTAVDESVQDPSLAVFYRPVSGSEGRSYQFFTSRDGVPMNAQVLEYAGLGSEAPVAQARSQAGNGPVSLAGTAEAGALVFAAAAADPHARIDVAETDEARVWSRTFGGGSVSLQTFDARADAAGAWSLSASPAQRGKTRLAAVVLRPASRTSVDAAGPAPLLRLSIAADPLEAVSGGTVSLRLTLRNDGSAPAHRIEVDTPPESVWQFSKADVTDGSFSPFGHRWSLARLEPGASATMSFQAELADALPDTALIAAARIRSFDEAETLVELPQALAAVDILPDEPAVLTCPPLGAVTVSATGSGDPGFADVAVGAPGATYAVVSATLDRRDGVYVPIGETGRVPVASAASTVPLYAWAGNACRVSFVERADVSVTPREAEPPEGATCAGALPAVRSIVDLHASGAEADAVLTILHCIGYLDGDLPLTFDERASEAVRAFQRDHGLAPIGIVGPATRVLLNAYRELLQK